MDDIKRLFEDDVREKKRIASNASRKAGRSMKNMFLYEKMTGKERKQYMAASEVKTFSLRPMTLAEFGRHTTEQKIELLKWYGEKYGWFAGALANALNCSWQGASNQLKKYGLDKFFAERNLKATYDERSKQRVERQKLVEQLLLTEVKEEPTITTENVSIKLPEPKKAKKEPPKQDDDCVIYQIALRGGRKGKCLQEQLNAIAETLCWDEAYVVELSIKQFASAAELKDGTSNVQNA